MPAIAAWRRILAALPVLIATVLAVTLIGAAPADAVASKRDKRIKHGLHVALKQKGDPYRYGAAGPGSFDCSGLTMYAYGKAGFKLARSSDGQARQLRHIGRKKLERGDFVFFHNGGNVYHAAIYLGKKHGDRYILHSPYTGKVVQRDKIWTNSWFGATLRPKHEPMVAKGKKVRAPR